MSKDIVVTNEQIKALEAVADYAFNSQHFSKLGGKPAIFCIALYAQELGLNPMTCLFGGMRAIQGNIEISPRMMNTMIRKAGHRLEILQSDDSICKIKGIRCDTKEEYTASFSLDDARRAGLVRSGGGWEKYASDMLFARCISRLSRRLFADVISTAYVEGEIDRDETAQKAPESMIAHQSEPVATQVEDDGEKAMGRNPKSFRPNEDTQMLDEKPKEVLISMEEAYNLDRDIQMMISPTDPGYRERALKALQKSSFDQVGASQLKRLQSNVAKKIEELKIKKKDVEDSGESIPF